MDSNIRTFLFPFKDINATRFTVTTLAFILGITGMIHGFFEILQGDKQTEGILIQAIGPEYQHWLYGGEEAFTLIPNYLYTGLVAVITGFAVIIWTLFFIHKKHGSLVFLVLNFVSFFSGGGIFQIVTFTMTWIFSTRINGSLKWWEDRISNNVIDKMSKYWFIINVMAIIPYLTVQVIGIYGYVPGISDPEIIINIVLMLLIISLSLFILAFICGFSYEIHKANKYIAHSHPL